MDNVGLLDYFYKDLFNDFDVNRFKYELKQGDTLNADIEVYDVNNQRIDVANADEIEVYLFIKDKPFAGYTTSTQSAFYNDELEYLKINSYNYNIINIDIDTKTFPIGFLIAITRVQMGAEIKEYSFMLGKIRKGFSNKL